MVGFADEAVIVVASGKGGAGAVSFRREKFVPKGGPDGGDGGKGGSVRFQVQPGLKTLAHLRQRRHFRAKNGEPGGGARRHGADGADVVIGVPPGTLLRDSKTKALLVDLNGLSDYLFLPGGIGGKGNWHFRSATRRTPSYAQKGLPGEERELLVELNLIADVGFVGFPNAGKSSLLKAVTHAHPLIAAYPFTTKVPNLGVLQVRGNDIILADIPGIIEGAAQGAGLGIRFLKHISRTSVLAFLVDLSAPNYLTAFSALCTELAAFSPDLLQKPRVVIGNKTDLDPDGARFAAFRRSLPGETVFPLSSFDPAALPPIADRFLQLVTRAKQAAAASMPPAVFREPGGDPLPQTADTSPQTGDTSPPANPPTPHANPPAPHANPLTPPAADGDSVS